MQSQEVSRVHSTSSVKPKKRKKGRGKEQIRWKLKPLHPQYIVGFIDGEGSLCVCIYYDEKMKNKIFVRPALEIELRADDKKILERIQRTLKCGTIFECKYERYGWYPHMKYRIARMDEIIGILIPFLEKYPLQAKKAEVFKYFKKIVQKRMNGEHLTKKGVKEILELRSRMRVLGKKHPSKTARVRENRLLSGVRR